MIDLPRVCPKSCVARQLMVEALLRCLTLASIVEREAAIDSERARIAGVFAYRQEVGMGLGSDVTLIYMID